MEENVRQFLSWVKESNPGESEFLQAVEEVAEAVLPIMDDHPRFKNMKILERMVEPERVITFRVPWLDDNGNVQVNRGYRIEMNSAIGPYKGGLRFHPSVNLGILKFLGFEQVFKNSLNYSSNGRRKRRL
jgi:glutamate dehydrogenase (NADP+)